MTPAKQLSYRRANCVTPVKSLSVVTFFSLRHALLEHGSHEAFQLLKAILPGQEMMPDASARMFRDFLRDFNGRSLLEGLVQRQSLTAGMGNLPSLLIERAMSENTR